MSWSMLPVIMLVPTASTKLAVRFFFFNDTATTEIYTLSLHDALPILKGRLKPGVSREQARAELATLWNSLKPLHSEADRNRVVGVRTELQARVQSSPPDAYLIGMLMALVAVVLKIGRASCRERV